MALSGLSSHLTTERTQVVGDLDVGGGWPKTLQAAVLRAPKTIAKTEAKGRMTHQGVTDQDCRVSLAIRSAVALERTRLTGADGLAGAARRGGLR